MSAHSHDVAADKKSYWQVFWWLSALTLFELVAVHFPISKMMIALILIILACTKAAMVAAVYMHLASEKTTLRWIAITPMILCVWLVLMLTPDLGSLRRIWTHHTPAPAAAESGHHE